MRIWLIGAGRAGTAAIRQLQKNPNVEIIVSDPHERPRAVEDGVIQKVDILERITLININEVASRVRPDLILIAGGTGAGSFGSVTGVSALSDAFNYEIAIQSNIPCLVLSRSNLT